MKKISAASIRQDVADLETLTKIAKRVQELETTQSAITDELRQLAEALTREPTSQDNALSTNEPLRRNGIRVTLDWPGAGIHREKVLIEERKGSMTLVSFLAEIYAALGDNALSKVASLRISRGPLISKQPEEDFINRSSGAIYAHHRIPQTSYFVITHSGTTEKIDAIHSVAKLLNLQDIVRAVRT